MDGIQDVIGDGGDLDSFLLKLPTKEQIMFFAILFHMLEKGIMVGGSTISSALFVPTEVKLRNGIKEIEMAWIGFLGGGP